MADARIRVIALGLVLHQQRLLVAEGYDRVKQDSFYRALGGGVEFGETSRAALQREFQEELGAELVNLHYLGCVENLFVYNGQPGHELIQLYRCDFADTRLYDREQIPFVEDNGYEGVARWIACSRFHSGELRLVPSDTLAFLPPSKFK